jgi:hypothetical protein
MNDLITIDIDSLVNTIKVILDNGIRPDKTPRGQELRLLIRLLWKNGGYMDNAYFKIEKERQENMLQKYEKLKEQFPNHTKEWWLDTYGFDIVE